MQINSCDLSRNIISIRYYHILNRCTVRPPMYTRLTWPMMDENGCSISLELINSVGFLFLANLNVAFYTKTESECGGG